LICTCMIEPPFLWQPSKTWVLTRYFPEEDKKESNNNTVQRRRAITHVLVALACYAARSHYADQHILGSSLYYIHYARFYMQPVKNISKLP
jgi:hypothetical protein